MNRQRRLRIARRVLIGLLVVPLLAWLGISLGAKLTVAREVPFVQLAGMVGQALLASVMCPLIGCEAELVEGLELLEFADERVHDTPVAIDIDESGRVYVAESARQNAGAEDNRSHPDWLMEDLAARTLEDRRAYLERALAEGRFEAPDHFTRNEDRIAVLEDEDGDGRADRRTELVHWNEMLAGLTAGVEAREGTLWATSIPSLYQLRDEDGDGVPEVVDELVRGFGVKTSLIGHDLHGLAWGPDGKLYFSMGDRGYHLELDDGRILEPSLGPGRGAIFRMSSDGSDLEVFATGVRNPQELAFDDYGNLFTGDNNGDGGDAARLVYLVEGGETGWAMPYQTLAGDYVRGPWMAERLWELQHPTQPAWILPPVAHVGKGPSGFVHYPGLGLPSRYAGHFFLCDYGYTNGRSGVWSFAVTPKGASFEIADLHPFAWSMLATDFDFGWDGRMYASLFDQVGNRQSVVTLRHREASSDPRLAELRTHLQGTMSEKESGLLVDLLDFPDQRLRLRAQSELAARGETARLVRLARDRSAALIPRLHAIWGLGQIGRAGLRALAPAGLAWAEEDEDELRAQLARTAGDAGASWLAPALRAWLADDAARIRFFAAQALGALGDEASVAPLFELIRINADRDVYLRHAAVWALHRIGDREGVWSRHEDPSRSVRLGVLLALRHAGDARIAVFLADPDPLLVVEAARAIYDGPIEGAMPALAGLAPSLEPAEREDLQIGQALHRRVLGANVRLRSEGGAEALARYVADERQLESLRVLALEALGEFTSPPPRDLTMGFHRPLAAIPPEVLLRVFAVHGRALVDSSLGSRAIEIASRIGARTLTEEELLEMVSSPGEDADSRASALLALRARVAAGGSLAIARDAAERGLAADEARVRAAARDLLLSFDGDAGLAALLAATSQAPSLLERQHAWRSLGDLDTARARARLDEALSEWRAGRLETAVGLDVIQAAMRQADADPGLAGRAGTMLFSSQESASPESESPSRDRRWALAGGDPEAGRLVFQTVGECQRCHGGGGHAAGVGPDLEGVARRGAAYVLESLLDPQAEITGGFGSVTLTRDDGSRISGLLVEEDESILRVDVGSETPIVIARAEIVEMRGPVSGMPAMGLGLEPAALRDLVAYVMSLEEPPRTDGRKEEP